VIDQHPRNRLLSLAVTGGGFLDGLRADLSAGVTCVIGGRGSGKTTLLELLAFAVQGAESAASEQVRANLGPGTLHVVLETKHGARYTVERRTEGGPRITDAEGRAVTAAINQLVPVDYFPAHAIEKAALDVGSQLRLIDGFAADEMHAFAVHTAQLERELQTNAMELQRLVTAESEKRDGAAEATLLEEKLKGLQPSGPKAGNLAAVTEAAALRHQERQAITNAVEALGKTRDDAARFGQGIARRFATLVDDAVLGGVNAEAMGAVAARLATAKGACERALRAIADACDVAEEGVQDTHRHLVPRHEEQEAVYVGQLAQAKDESARSDERQKLQQKYAAALTARKQLEQVQTERRDIEQKRRALLARAAQLRDLRFQRRRTIAADITRQVGPAVRVTIKQDADRRAYTRLLTECLRNSKMQYTAIVEKLAELSPDDLASYVKRGDAHALAERAGVDDDRARRVIDKLTDCDILCRIEAVELGDAPRIELLDGVYKDTANISTGQRCTAILPIVLLGSERPLLIDQPEDNMDGEFLCEVIVKSICAVKARRQIVLATHNANIVVLSHADRVFVLRSDGKHAWLAAGGAVDDVKEHVQRLLEGGAEAFVERMHRYGY
jgi:energy-coupling factor transporter ATP-binding protein EcfA2